MKALLSAFFLTFLVACSNGEQKFDCNGIGLALTTKGAKFANNSNLVYCKTEGVWNFYGTGDCKNVDNNGLIFDTVTHQIIPSPSAKELHLEPISCKKVN